jgi:hypothetical protein
VTADPPPLADRVLRALAAWRHPEVDHAALTTPAGARAQHKRVAAVLAEAVAADPSVLDLPPGSRASWLVAASGPDDAGTHVEHHLVRLHPGDGSPDLLLDPAARRHAPDGPSALVFVEEARAAPPAPWEELRVVDGDLAAYLRAQRLSAAWTARGRGRRR